MIRVTHPHHPWSGQEFEFVVRRRNWGEDRVYLRDAEGVVVSLPSSWTDLEAPDVFVVVSAGRCPFRLADLVALAGLVEALRGGARRDPCGLSWG